MTNTVFGRLQYNFDSTKFGDALTLSDAAIETINSSPLAITQWQETDISDNVVSRSRYFRNPTINVCNQIISNLTLISVNANTANLSNVEIAANNTILEMYKFISHSSNISGVNKLADSDAAIPMYETAMGIGDSVLRLTNKTDGVENTSPVLGMMTSLFIGPELTSNSNLLYTDSLTLNASLQSVTVGMQTIIRSNLSSVSINTILSHITTANNMVYTRRNHDWNMFQKGRDVLADYSFLNQFNMMGNTKTFLVNNYIGTSYLTNQLAANN